MGNLKKELFHYASPYYDPQKAHEYYIKNRELKGRRSSSKLNDKGKEVWAYTKEEISSEKKEKTEQEKTSRDQKIEAARKKASEAKERISKRLAELRTALSVSSASKKKKVDEQKAKDVEMIDQQTASEKERISTTRDLQIEKLMNETIPKNLSKEERARRIEQRNEKIAKLRDDAKKETYSISENAKTEKTAVRSDASVKKSEITNITKESRQEYSDQASKQRKEVANQLKSIIEAARAAYKMAKENLNASYENILQREFDKIAAEMPKVTKKRK